MKFIGGITAGLLLVSAAYGQKLAADLRAGGSSEDVPVIVQFDHQPSERDHGRVLARGGRLRARLHLVNAGAYTVRGADLEALSQDPAIVHISRDHGVSAKLDYSVAAINALPQQIGYLDGSGIGVAVIDSGISDDGGKGGQEIYQEDFTAAANGKTGDNINDEYGHGQHIAGIIGATGKVSCPDCTRLLQGVAPNVNFVDLRVLDANGQGTDSGVIAAIGRAIGLKQKYNIRVINLSLGRPVYESYKQDPLCQAVEAAWKAGIVVVVAAGNEGRNNFAATSGYGTITAPGNDPYVLTVGAMKTEATYSRTDDLIASYSSKGPSQVDHVVKPDLIAPGNRVVSLLSNQHATLLQNYPQNAVATSYYLSKGNDHLSKDYFMLSGTSMAAAVASGAVAILLQAHPELTPDQVKARLMKTAYKQFPVSSVAVDSVTGSSYFSQYDVFTVGAGYLDLAAALANNDVFQGVALSPAAYVDSGSGKVYLSNAAAPLGSNQAVWGTQSVWGTQAVWGTSVVDAAQSVWGTQAVWGTSTVGGFQAVWGTQSVWGTSSTAASEALPITIAGEQ